MTDKQVTEIVAPQLGANDTEVTIIQWHYEQGSLVSEGNILLDVETSKTSMEIEAPCDGVLHQLHDLEAEVTVGKPIALIGTNEAAINDYINAFNESQQGNADVEATKKAKKLAQELDVDLSRITSKGIIREIDVKNFHELEQTNELKQETEIHELNEGKLDAEFLNYLLSETESFASLDSNTKLQRYTEAGAEIGKEVSLGDSSVIIANNLVLKDGVKIEGKCKIRADKVSIGAEGMIRSGFDCDCRSLFIGDEVFIARDVIVGRGGNREPTARLTIGHRVFIGERVLLNTGQPITIDDGCFIGQFTSIMTHNIGYSYLDGYDNAFAPVHFSENVQLGVNCFVYPGVTLGSGSVIISNSAVMSNIPAGKMSGGIPAAVIGNAKKELNEKARQGRFRKIAEGLIERLRCRDIVILTKEDTASIQIKFEYQR